MSRALIVVVLGLLAQQAPDPLATSRPARDPKQPIDADYTRRIHEDTTEPFFLSPLVDYAA